MKLRLILITLIILSTIVLSGCWDYAEYEGMAQVSAIGYDLDKKSGEIIMTVQYIPTAKTKGGATGSPGSSATTQIVHSVKAKSIFEAIQEIQQVTFKNLFYGYLKVIVISEDVAKHNMMDIMELEDRSPAIRDTANIVITSGKAEDTISTLDVALASASSEEINNLVKLAETTGATYPVTVHDFTAMLAVPGREATAPRIITVAKKPEVDAKGGIEKNVRYEEERTGAHRATGVAAFKEDKFVGWLDAQESLGLGWITGKKIRAYKASANSNKADTADIFFYRVSTSKGKIKVKLNKDKPEFLVDVKVDADLRKNYSRGGSAFLTPKEVRVMEEKLSDSVRSDIEAALRRGQKELKTDIFGFGFALFRENPRLWRTNYEKKWMTLFPGIPVHVNVEAKVMNTGTNLKQLKLQ